MSNIIDCATCGAQVEIDDYEGVMEVYECPNSQCPHGGLHADKASLIPVDIYMEHYEEYSDEEEHAPE